MVIKKLRVPPFASENPEIACETVKWCVYLALASEWLAQSEKHCSVHHRFHDNLLVIVKHERSKGNVAAVYMSRTGFVCALTHSL